MMCSYGMIRELMCNAPLLLWLSGDFMVCN